LLSLALLACSAATRERAVREAGLGPRISSATAEERTPRGEYLHFLLKSPGYAGELWVRNTPRCQAVLASPDLRYDRSESYGSVEAGEERCRILGIGSLGYVRSLRPRPPLRGRPREQANFRVIYRDPDLAIAHGEFGLAGLLGWPYARDTLAVIPIRPECEGPLERGMAALEYHASGGPPLVLLGEKGDCPIEGLITPAGGGG
jgi:hypothetical protein